MSSSIRGRIRRSISLPATFSYRRKDSLKQFKKKRSLQENCEVLDDTGSEESLPPPPPASGVTVSVQDEVVRKTVAMPITEEDPLDHYEDSQPSCLCMTDEHLFTSLMDEFFSQQPEQPAYCRQESTSSSITSYDEVTTQIECILQAAYAEDKEKLVEDEDVMIPPQIDVSMPAGQLPPPCLSEWKQHPLLLTATPNSGMTIRGIRRLCDPSFFDSPVNSGHTNNDNGSLMQLPINNGKEQPGQSLVIDFETELFAGTALFRIRDCNTEALSTEDDNSVANKHDYFGDKNRKYQVVIRGRFKQKVVMVSCMSGLLLDRPLAISRKVNSNAPPRWILRAAVRIANILSPRMDAELECAHPRVLSPLCSTAQTIRKDAQKEHPVCLDEPYEEPHFDSSSSLVADLKKRGGEESDANYAQYRKRIFNNIYDDYVQSKSSESPHFDDSEYTFEFLQHLVDYNDLSLDLGRAMGKIKLGAGLRGQPVRITAISNAKDEQGGFPRAVISEKTSLWAFDLWHASNVVEEE